jgi:hypothetical protein
MMNLSRFDINGKGNFPSRDTLVKSLGGGGPLSHKQGGLIHQLGVWLGRDLKNGLLLLLLLCNILCFACIQ